MSDCAHAKEAKTETRQETQASTAETGRQSDSLPRPE